MDYNVYRHDKVNFIGGNGISISVSGSSPLYDVLISSDGISTLDIIDDILHWDGSKYTLYDSKKVSDPGYPYFYNALTGGYPSYVGNQLTLDGRLNCFIVSAIGSDTLYSKMFPGVIEAVSDGNFLQLVSNPVGSPSACLITSYTSSASIPLIIGSLLSSSGYHNEYINIDDFNRLFEINMTNIKLTKGTPSKWLALDSNGFITYQDTPSGSYVHPTQSAISLSLTGATVLASLVVNTLGHTTSYTTRTLTASDLGVNMADVVHISGTETITGDKTFTATLNTAAINADTASGGITIDSTSDYIGIRGTGAVGVWGQSYIIPLTAFHLDTTPSGIRTCLAIESDAVNTTVEDEYGLRIDWNLPSKSNINIHAGQIDCIWTDSTLSVEDSRYEFYLMDNGMLHLVGTLDNVGNLTVSGDIASNNFKQTVYTITLPNAGSVALRCAGTVAGVDYPATWTIGAYGLNPNDLQITHNLGRRIAYVSVFENNGTDYRQLFANAAYSGIWAQSNNILNVEALATISSAIIIQLIFA